MTERSGFLNYGFIKTDGQPKSAASKKYQLRAVNEARTRDPQLGKLMLYQLSYYRIDDSNAMAKLVIFLYAGKFY